MVVTVKKFLLHKDYMFNLKLSQFLLPVLPMLLILAQGQNLYSVSQNSVAQALFKGTEKNNSLRQVSQERTFKKPAKKQARAQERIKKRKEWEVRRQKEHENDPVYSSFDNGMVFIVMANFSGSLTDPYISNNELKKMGANFFKGGTGFIMGGEAQLGYVFGKNRWFPSNKTKEFSALGLFFYLGVSQGVATQSSGSLQGGEQINVYFSAKYTPVLSFGIAHKVYFFYNRMAIGANLGMRMIADPTPEYYFYSTHPNVFATEVGTLIVTSEMIKRMNAIAFSIGGFIEYNQPILRTVQMVLRLYASYHIYKPKYITMPPKLENSAKQEVNFDPSQPLNSFYLNSFDFGLSIGLAFKSS